MDWAVSPENNRAPGTTCLWAIERFAEDVPWFEASEHGSMGCGANMRVAPVGLVPELTAGERAAAVHAGRVDPRSPDGAGGQSADRVRRALAAHRFGSRGTACRFAGALP